MTDRESSPELTRPELMLLFDFAYWAGRKLGVSGSVAESAWQDLVIGYRRDFLIEDRRKVLEALR